MSSEVDILIAAQILRAGGRVVIPTETVYGLAAVATNPDAVRSIFTAKGRPANNPLIVHIAHLEQLPDVVREWPERAAKLAQRFWPGPLTIVLPKSDLIPPIVTAGLDTVGVRIPAHPVALRLLDAVQRPLAAPSANRFMSLSPTRAEDVHPGLAAHVLDGGPCEVGLESTIVDLSGPEPVLLRPGGLSRAEIESVLGEPLLAPTGSEQRAPGMHPRHYAPKTPIRIAEFLTGADAGLTLDVPLNPQQIALKRDARSYGISMYAALHRLDAMKLDEIVIQRPPRAAEWEAVWDRLKRATTSDESL